MQILKNLATALFMTGHVMTANAGTDVTATQVTLEKHITRVEVWSENVVRITHTPNSVSNPRSSLSVIGTPKHVDCTVEEQDDAIRLATEVLHIELDKASGSIRILDNENQLLFSEAANGTTIKETTITDVPTRMCSQSFRLDPGEAIYGLGQMQNGTMNYVGHTAHLQQKNGWVAMPVAMSSKGYMLLWDNPAVTDVNVGETDPGIMHWSSEAGDQVDYYFIYGPDLDDAVKSYRQLTGKAPMFSKWAWGLWQCKERYASQKELLEVLKQYREMNIPLDCVIQDWQYWEPGQWGSHTFEAARFPDPKAMVDEIHANNAHVIISIWPRFDLDTNNLAELDAAKALYRKTYNNVWPKGVGRWYDAYSPTGRDLYWQQVRDNLAVLGFDGWWMDGCEAELGGAPGQMREVMTAAGPGPEVYNAYPLMHASAAYEGQRKDIPEKRVLILARSAYPGQQRNAVITWSGDIHGDWPTYARQIPAGLNFCATGTPYWNTDIGGFFGGDPADPAYAELFTRWFQFSTFNPMFRIHGTGKGKEVWKFDQATQKILIDFDQLRYRLLPYIYSVSWMVTDDDYTMMRPLVMDYREDPKVYDIADQFMFGPNIMVCPVIEAGATSRQVYLPKGNDWYDFWTGKQYAGGQTISVHAPIQKLPLFVPAGAIIPFGPLVQYATEKTDPIELRVYRGANCTFKLYEDEGDTYNYEDGIYATISFGWDDTENILSISERQGHYPGMMKTHTFNIVFVDEQSGTGIQPDKIDTTVTYNGQAISIQVP